MTLATSTHGGGPDGHGCTTAPTASGEAAACGVTGGVAGSGLRGAESPNWEHGDAASMPRSCKTADLMLRLAANDSLGQLLL